MTSGLLNLGDELTWRATRRAFKILARIAGYTDDAAEDAWERGDRELVITAALRGQ